MTDTNNDELLPTPEDSSAEQSPAIVDPNTNALVAVSPPDTTSETVPPDRSVVPLAEGEVEDDGEDEYSEMPPWQRAIIAVGSLGLAYYAQINLFRDPPDAVYSGNILIFLGGLALFFVMIFNLLRTTILQLGGKLDAFPAKQVQRFRLGVIWIFIAIGIMAYVAWRTVERPPTAYLWEHLVLTTLAMASLYIGLRISKKSPKIPDNLPFLRWEYIAIIGLVVAALLIRGVNIENLPYMLDQDEGAFAREGAVLALRENYRTSPFEIGTYSYTRWHQLMIGITTNILGVTKTAARLPSVIMGSLAILAIYLLGRELYNRQIGLIAALFALGWTYQIHFSRLALNQPGDPLFSTLALYFLLRGLRRRTVINYYYSGLFLGIAQFFYLGARLVPIVMVAYLVWLFIRQREVIMPQWKLLLIVPLTAFVVTMPQNYFIYFFKEPFTTRFDKSIFNDTYPAAVENGTVNELIRNQIVFSFTGFITSSDRGGWFGVGSNIMDPFGGPLLVLGALITLVLFWARPKWVLPLGWGLGVVIGGSVINNTPPAYERYHPGITAFCLLCAVGIWAIVEGLTVMLNRPRWTERALLAAGGLIFALNLGFYVFDFVPARNYFNNRPNWQTNAVSDVAVKAYETGHQVVLLGGFESGVDETNVLRYYMANKDYVYLDEPFPPASSKAQEIDYQAPLTFIIAPKRATDDLATLQGMYSNGTTREVKLAQDGSTAFWVFETGTPSS